MEEEKKKLEKLYQELNESDTVLKKWNQALIPKAILLFPPIAFALTFLKINTDCLLYTSPSPRDSMTSRMPSSA